MKKAQGGYFELALAQKKTDLMHKQAIAVNTGRNGLRYILQAKKYKKIYLPYFTCDVVLDTIKEEGLFYEFYDININLEPLFDWQTIKTDEVFMYTNYFGVKDSYIKELVKYPCHFIIDNAQAFYAEVPSMYDSFYSPRKFLGVADGGYVYCNHTLIVEEKDVSYNRMMHLLKRLELGAEAGYSDFLINEESLNRQPIKQMSVLTQHLIDSQDHKGIREKRVSNYMYLYEVFKKVNKLNLPLAKESVPMVFPLWIDKNIKEKLHQQRYYTATYWANVLQWTEQSNLAYQLTKEVVYLPIDQRVLPEDLEEMVKLILN
ncbi:hypothetical protein LNQ81_12490 [Myroides sp. M-43]|uniref:hypothetical protein n=1 Tax=Myroides oncorhynchi TaxID=2893756 RepID=UPI001E370BB2|nr:hypothetical protein [Myroides oncorhynchi]MCC9043490.1 hypothetical protein [Myroides oncorhynchi]